MVKKHVVDEIVESMVDKLQGDSLRNLFHKTAGMGPCTFCGMMGHTEDDCPKAKKQDAKDHECDGNDGCEECKKMADARNHTLKNLAAIANALDNQGFTKLCDIVDETMKKIADVTDKGEAGTETQDEAKTE